MTSHANRTSNMVAAWRIAIPVVLLNAVIQALLLVVDPSPPLTWWIWPLALVSFAAIVVTLAVILAALLLGARGDCSWSGATSVIRSRLLPLALYAAGLVIASIIGFALWVLPGLIVLALTPYLLIAVMAGEPNPIMSNLRAIRARVGRWILLLLVTGVVGGALWVGSALVAFFVPGTLGTFLTWLVIGLAGTALVQMWCRAWRSTAPLAASSTG